MRAALRKANVIDDFMCLVSDAVSIMSTEIGRDTLIGITLGIMRRMIKRGGAVPGSVRICDVRRIAV